jgi:hypothetical protein
VKGGHLAVVLREARNLAEFPNTPFELAQCASREDASYNCNSTYFPEVIDSIVETIVA